MTEPRSNLHVVTGHDGKTWLTDLLVEGDFRSRVKELLDGEPERERELVPGASHAFYRGSRTVLVMTFGPEVDRTRAEELLSDIREGRDDTN